MRRAWKPLCCLTLCSTLGLTGCQTMQSSESQLSDGGTATEWPHSQRASADIRSNIPSKALAADEVFHPEATQESDSASDGAPDDLWERIREGFHYDLAEHPEIREDIDWYAERPRFLNNLQTQARPYLHFIVEEIEQRGLPMELALLPALESSFVPSASSPAGAGGIWQFTSGTGARFGLKQNSWYDGRMDVVASTHAALDYLEQLANQFNGDWGLALAAYNAGEMTVQRAIDKNIKLGKPTDFWSLDLPKETKLFFPRLIAITELIKNPDQYGFNLDPIPNVPYFKPVAIDEQIDLKEAAKLAGIPAAEIKRLNPGFKRWATAPDGPQTVNLPIDKADEFAERMNTDAKSLRVQLREYEVRRGDTLGGIAARFGVGSAELQKANHLKGNKLSVGQTLLLPMGADQVAAVAPQPPTKAKSAPRKEKGRVEYLVKAGDSLWDIARAHKVRGKDIAKWNKLSEKATLQPGMTLVIYTG